MKVCAIDPGTTDSAFVIWDEMTIQKKGITANYELRILLEDWRADSNGPTHYAIEMVQSFGMPVGKTIFETVFWIGRFWEIIGPQDKTKVYRKDIKLHHCETNRAKDTNIRHALIDKYGEPGIKANQGMTYGLKKDMWSAFAIATFITETKHSKWERN